MDASVMKLDLESGERAAVEAVEARLSQRARFPVRLDRLLSNWSTFAANVEAGYASSIDEYISDLATREVLDEALVSLPAGVKTKIGAVLSPLDRRFEQATRADDAHRLEKFVRLKSAWWWRRIPVKLTGPLAAALL
ncbi:MAG: hypothetical protein ACYDAB_14485 [bacterium]